MQKALSGPDGETDTGAFTGARQMLVTAILQAPPPPGDTLQHVEAKASASQPGNRAAAPGELQLVQEFVNSLNKERGVDFLTDEDALRRWLGDRSLVTKADQITAADLDDAHKLREALRAILVSHTMGDVDPSSLAPLRTASLLRVVAADDGSVSLSPVETGARGAWAQLLAIAVRASHDGRWPRLKACRDERCQWAFYDHSRNRSAQWCTMDLCGARDKMRRYRQRQRG